MRYRANIDGLRALVVLAGVFFHLNILGFPGGFIGVDVFFVISGLLVTRNIQHAANAGNFSFLDFYTKRVRRFLPALALVLALTTLSAIWVFFPSDLDQYGRSLAATQLFSANIFFWRTSGYFETASELKPLLHTGSLAIKERFCSTKVRPCTVTMGTLRSQEAVRLASCQIKAEKNWRIELNRRIAKS